MPHVRCDEGVCEQTLAEGLVLLHLPVGKSGLQL